MNPPSATERIPVRRQPQGEIGWLRRNLSPNGTCYCIWECILCLLIIATAVFSPIELVFVDKSGACFYATEIIILAFFSLDILYRFFMLVANAPYPPEVISKRQMAWGMAFSFMSVAASIAVLIFSDDMLLWNFMSHLYAWGWLALRISTLFRVSPLSARLEKYLAYEILYFWEILKLIILTFIYVNSFACMFYQLTFYHNNPENTWIGGASFFEPKDSIWAKYVASMYVSITTFSTVGFGDFHPMNVEEMILCSLWILFGLGLTFYLGGHAVNLLVRGTSTLQQLGDLIEAGKSLARRLELSDSLQDQILTHLKLKFQAEREQKILHSLPPDISSSITDASLISAIEKIDIFQGVSWHLLRQLASAVTVEYFCEKQDVIVRKDRPTYLYILVYGALDVHVREAATANAGGVLDLNCPEIKSCNICGEIGVFCNMEQLFTVRAKKVSKVLCLERTKLLKIARENDVAMKGIIENLLKHGKSFGDPVTKNALAEIETIGSNSDTYDGENLLLHHLVKKKTEV